MNAYEAITSEQLKFEDSVGPPVSYKDQRIGLITDAYSKVEDYFNETKTATIDGIKLESKGSWTGPQIIEEDGKRKLSYVCRSVNPYRYHNPIQNLRHWDNVIVPQTFNWLGRDVELLKKTKFVGLNIQLQEDLALVIKSKPCTLCPIKFVSIEQFQGEDLKTHTFDQPGEPDNIDQIQIDNEKFWAINVYLSLVVIKALRLKKEYKILAPPKNLIQKISDYMIKSFISSIDPPQFEELDFPKGPDGKYDIDLWPSIHDEHFVSFITKLIPEIQTDDKLSFLTTTSSPLQLTI